MWDVAIKISVKHRNFTDVLVANVKPLMGITLLAGFTWTAVSV